jgi:hypothetical protein
VDSVFASVHKLVPDGLIDPLPDGIAANEIRYWVFQLATAVLGLLIISRFEAEADPVASPVQPLKTY